MNKIKAILKRENLSLLLLFIVTISLFKIAFFGVSTESEIRTNAYSPIQVSKW